MRWSSRFPSLLFVAVLATPAPAADAVRVVEARSIPLDTLPPPVGATHELRLHLYAFQGTRWQAGDIAAAVREAAPLLAQCRVALSGAELQLLDAPQRFRYYFTPLSRELLRGMAVARPAIFFVEDTRNEPAFDAEAIGRANAATRPELADTIWVAYGASDLPLALAHELVHLLSDSGEHSAEPANLMRPETAPENTRLSAAQCERVRVRGEANSLLARRAK